MNVLRETNDEKLKRGWVVLMPSLRDQYGTSLFKVVKISDFGAALLPFKSLINKKFRSKEEEDMFYSKSRLIHISSTSSVKVIGIHRTGKH